VLLVYKQRVKPPECSPSFPQLKLCNQTLTYNEKATFLGLTFDKYLTIKGKEWGTDKKCLHKIYQSLIKSKLDYGTLRIVTGAYRSTRTIALQAECGELPLNYQREIN
ncbi:hypothetical protein MAR_001827, partial [Mya arenaria]